MIAVYANPRKEKFLISGVFLLIGLQFFGLFGELMEADAALYASIAKTIVSTNDWGNLYVNSADWLDKPHLTFWLAAASFKIFGISAFAYKLPSFLLGLVGIWYLFKLAKLIYSQQVALIAVIISMSALHQVISNYDVRAEGYLSTFAIAAIYHFYRAQRSTFKHIIAGSLFSAFAVMVKGIFVLIPIVGGFVLYWILTKQFDEFKKIKWYVGIFLMLLIISPELWTLYQQFDLHPEKVVFGRSNVSGIRFFFWDSQFGRFFNNGPIKGRGELSFFIHTTLWAFLPWSITFVAALVQLARKEVRRFQKATVIIIWGSAALTFLIFSLSQFQLPHYIIIIFPQFAMVTANYIAGLDEQQEYVFGKIHAALAVIIILMLVMLTYFLKVEHDVVFYVLAILLIGTVVVVTYKRTRSLIKNAFITSFALFVFLYGFFYPTILKYQAGLQAAKWMAEHAPNLKPASLDQHTFAFDFYHKEIVRHLDFNDLDRFRDRESYAFFVKDEQLPALNKKFSVTVMRKFKYFRITKMKAKFVNASTRDEVLTHFYLVKIK